MTDNNRQEYLFSDCCPKPVGQRELKLARKDSCTWIVSVFKQGLSFWDYSLKWANGSVVETGKMLPISQVWDYKIHLTQIPLQAGRSITKACIYKYTENFTNKKGNFSDKTFWYFHISSQNIICGYSLEPPQRGGSNAYPQSTFLAKKKKKKKKK